VTRATTETTAGTRYLDLQREARRTGRPTDELIQLYALECFLDRLVHSNFADNFVLKGGVLLAALDARRPTRDIDLSARALDNDAAATLEVIRKIAAIALDDGLIFDSAGATAEAIREDDNYSGVRVTLGGTLSRAIIRLHVDVNVGDPIWPEPMSVRLPRLLDGQLVVRAFSLEMVLAEKIVTAIARGTANTRWRDFVDIYTLARRHNIDGKILRQSLLRVAEYRDVALAALHSVLADYAEIAQQRWLAWLRKQRMESTVPTEFPIVLGLVVAFADPVIAGDLNAHTWESEKQSWISGSE
jgi:predicted nucleotidyltransferase component of viral defense system